MCASPLFSLIIVVFLLGLGCLVLSFLALIPFFERFLVEGGVTLIFGHQMFLQVPQLAREFLTNIVISLLFQPVPIV